MKSKGTLRMKPNRSRNQLPFHYAESGACRTARNLPNYSGVFASIRKESSPDAVANKLVEDTTSIVKGRKSAKKNATQYSIR
jgi:hypothetical protein